MPLIKSGSKKALKKNIATEMEAHPGNPKQSLAIAFSVQRKNKRKKMAEGGGVSSEGPKVEQMQQQQQAPQKSGGLLSKFADGGGVQDEGTLTKFSKQAKPYEAAFRQYHESGDEQSDILKNSYSPEKNMYYNGGGVAAAAPAAQQPMKKTGVSTKGPNATKEVQGPDSGAGALFEGFKDLGQAGKTEAFGDKQKPAVPVAAAPAAAPATAAPVNEYEGGEIMKPCSHCGHQEMNDEDEGAATNIQPNIDAKDYDQEEGEEGMGHSPEDSNEHGHELSDADENDMIDMIRKKLRAKRA